MLRCSHNNNSLGLCVIIPVLESSSYNISLWYEFKRPTITFGWPTMVTQQQWLNTCEKHKEAEEIKRTQDLNRSGLLLDQQECVTGLFDTDFMCCIVKHLSYWKYIDVLGLEFYFFFCNFYYNILYHPRCPISKKMFCTVKYLNSLFYYFYQRVSIQVPIITAYVVALITMMMMG